MIRIIYFTGTGNSRLFASELAARLGAKDEAMREVKDSIADEAVLVFPVHCYDMPEYVRDFIARTDFATGAKIHAAITCGASIGNLPGKLATALRARGATLGSWVAIPMADNSVVLKTPKSTIEHNRKALPRLMDDFAHRVKEGGSTSFRTSPLASMEEAILKAGMRFWFQARNAKIDPKACVSCGSCEKVCPTGAITMKDGTPEIGPECSGCFGCMNVCPERAISFGRIKIDANHPAYRGFLS